MKLEYGSTTLGDDTAGDYILDDGGGHARVVQQEPLAGGTVPFTAARGNHSNQRGFTVSKEHADAKTAKAWFNRHPDTLADAGELRITEGDDADTMPDAVLVSVDRVQLTGRSTVLRYQFTGGQISQAT
jgi:hypothetical protein